MNVIRWILVIGLVLFALGVTNDGITDMGRAMNARQVDTVMQQQVLLLDAIANFILAVLLALLALVSWVVCSAYVPRKEAEWDGV